MDNKEGIQLFECNGIKALDYFFTKAVVVFLEGGMDETAAAVRSWRLYMGIPAFLHQCLPQALLAMLLWNYFID